MDDNRRQLVTIAVVSLLIGGGYLAAEVFMKPGKAEPPAHTTKADKTKADEDKAEKGSPNPKGPKEASASPHMSPEDRAALERTYEIETDSAIATFTNLNAGLRSYRIKGKRYRDKEGKPEELITTDKEAYLPLHLEIPGVNIPEGSVWQVTQPSSAELRFAFEGRGFRVTRVVKAAKAPYQLWSEVTIENRSAGERPVRLKETSYHYHHKKNEGGIFSFLSQRSPQTAHGVCRYGDSEMVRKDGEKLLTPHGYGKGDVHFTGVDRAYFAKMLAADGTPGARCEIRTEHRGGTLKEPQGTLFFANLVYPRTELAPGESATFRTLAYFGPKDPDALAAAGHELTQVVDLGWFSFIGKYLVRLLRWLHGALGNWGLAIILLTILVKLVLYPLTEKSFQSMARMRQLKPEMDRINELYKDDREKKGAAVMELYRKHKINPVGGCLPTMLQMPVWFALYQSLSTNVELYHAHFGLWWTDLSGPDPYYTLPLLLGGLMFLQQKLTPTTMDPAQAKMMMYFMPIFLTFIMLFLPAGLCLYMVTNSALGIAQQQFIHFRLDRQSPPGATADADESGADGDETGETSADTAESNSKHRRLKRSVNQSSRRRARGTKRRQRRGRA